ncbi:hypothetical protein NC796_12645 [Aliifodinibius sp. S!AR15-10]|uniref:hypothetical protein n=1 Tax=Aliifodinibius sp. S!AR15-10 TaxID=2950437 RepID=UPI0028565CAD|nr:hypothetical protein [Aliifodinibius sp. S!AR15-10]MDR8391998.1 hypothetical protein [Aliifodinibius sp. S!AR15-10]
MITAFSKGTDAVHLQGGLHLLVFSSSAYSRIDSGETSPYSGDEHPALSISFNWLLAHDPMAPAMGSDGSRNGIRWILL